MDFGWQEIDKTLDLGYIRVAGLHRECKPAVLFEPPNFRPRTMTHTHIQTHCTWCVYTHTHALYMVIHTHRHALYMVIYTHTHALYMVMYTHMHALYMVIHTHTHTLYMVILTSRYRCNSKQMQYIQFSLIHFNSFWKFQQINECGGIAEPMYHVNYIRT